jgi:hypothetical protein
MLTVKEFNYLTKPQPFEYYLIVIQGPNKNLRPAWENTTVISLLHRSSSEGSGQFSGIAPERDCGERKLALGHSPVALRQTDHPFFKPDLPTSFFAL